METAEPGGTAVGMAIRRILLDRTHRELAPVAELLLYSACRAQNVAQVIHPALAAGHVVLSDRFTDSTLAYQGFARGLGPDLIRSLDRIATGGLTPDLTILLDVDPQTGLARLPGRDRMETQPLEFYAKVRRAYMQLAAAEPGRFRTIDAACPVEAVARRVWEVVEPHVR